MAMSGRRGWVAAACVVTIVVGVFVVTRFFVGNAEKVPATTAVDSDRYIGITWVLSDFVHQGERILADPAHPAVVTFASDGAFQLNDSVNTASGRYTVTPGGFTTRDVTITLIAPGGDQAQLARVAAMDALILNGGAGGPVEVMTSLANGQLILDVPGYRCTFVRR
jgi:hypothetical protein